MRSRTLPLREVYVWELPVRVYHWVNMLSIVVLCITGYVIGNPPAFMKGTEASLNYWFGTVRFVHFVSAFIFFMDVIRVDVLQLTHKKIDSIGHNSLASLIYFVTFLLFLLQSLTGFGMYAAMSTSFLPKLFAWVVPLLGGDIHARQVHHVLMWGFILFAMVHVYHVFYHDYVERRGVTSSMIGGWKFIEEDAMVRHENRTEECPKSS